MEDCACDAVGSSSSSSAVLLSRGRGRIKAPSLAGSFRRGREETERVVARRRWLQKRQWWVWTGRRGGDCSEDVVVVVGGGVGSSGVGVGVIVCVIGNWLVGVG